jgi:hypothetical protein
LQYAAVVVPESAWSALRSSRRVLLSGCGGGYDVLGAVPLARDLLDRGLSVVFGNHSFCNLAELPGTERVDAAPTLFRVPAEAATADRYCPEAWLARWCEQHLDGAPVWAFEKTGARPLHAAYEHLVSMEQIDAIVLVDGGIDAILRGDESSLGTPAEDLASVAAVARLDVGTKLLVCVGLGAEMRDGICHAQAFDRIAELTRLGAYRGTTGLTPGTRASDAYLAAIDYLFENQRSQRTSHVHTVVRDALLGLSGSRGEHIWISPLLSLCWFFNLNQVASSHLFLEHLWDTTSSWEISARVEGLRKALRIKSREVIPI